ncbi:Ferrochelatase [Zhongshania aliphaticivorans]|uniref:Ferrochelatase n=1 Tax=Zhongshania aliphaticivorans TaxID=1470434 RepID=A0A5S9NB65_9GAMM|nr:ferrochelatase [Zhongshania aliphaticivorans]CAA0087377.1 Ferrochelatase [Zhongshania aliphaticivorans]CAA0114710.1 Ferrochelatase [Zhongshania aliphaticivorans]
MKTTGIIFINLGTPQAPNSGAVRKFLREFLSDRRVVEVPRVIWMLILYLIILPFRSPRVARNYKQIWMNDTSPLRYFSQRLVDGVSLKFSDSYPDAKIHTRLAMTYGDVSISSAINELLESGCERLFFIPLYPQYSATTTAAAHDQICHYFSQCRDIPEWAWLKSYYDHPSYIAALSKTVRQHWSDNGRAELLLMSFHGIPKRNVDLGDPYQLHCQKTAEALALDLGLNEKQWMLTYQSRLGKAEWLQPYTDKSVINLATNGTKTLDVICPAFAVECLETLEEIDGEANEFFIENGGNAFRYIPCLNDSEEHQNLLFSLCKPFLEEKNVNFR